jgi:hypothetical protein
LRFAFLSTTSNARSFEAFPKVSYAFMIFDSSQPVPHEPLCVEKVLPELS